MNNIVTDVTTVKDTAFDLDEEALHIRQEIASAEDAGRYRLNHAIAAGKHLLKVQVCIKRGFRRWLQDHGLSRSTCYDYMLLAQHEESIRSSGHSSVAAALRMLRTKSGKPNKSGKSSKSNSPLSKAAWTKATVEERRRFLDSIGTNAVCEALSLDFRSDLKRRVAGQQAAITSALCETIAAGVRQVLSLQKAAKAKEVPATGVASALNAINNKLATAGFDLNNLTVGINIAATQTEKAA